VKREQESTYIRVQKMMRGRVEPSTMPIVVKVVSIVVHATKQIIEIPQMTTPYET
jgi:hypothetical protein